MSSINPKQQAAEAAISFVRSGMCVGLGTGSTADFFLQALAAALREGRLRDIRAIPTSLQSQRRAQHLSIPLVAWQELPAQSCQLPEKATPATGNWQLATGPIDVTIDGADEISPNLDLIKGLGGALLREKIVAQNSRQLIIIADASKLVPVLGTKSALPVEVIPFAHETHVPFLRSLGAVPTLRTTPDGHLFTTDNGNHIYDCRFEKIDDPAALEQSLKRRAGIVESGLFLALASLALIGDDQGVRQISPVGAASAAAHDERNG